MRSEGGYAAAANSACAVDLRFMDEEIEDDADKQALPPLYGHMDNLVLRVS